MARDLPEAAAQFAELAKNLTLVGEEGLRRELYDAIDAAARPLADEIGNVTHLRAVMPDRYADVLARDLRVTVSKRTAGPETGGTVLARAPTFGRGGRKVRQRDLGVLVHPIFAQGPREEWRWVTPEQGLKGITPGFFTGPAERSAPRVRAAILAAMERIGRKATGKG